MSAVSHIEQALVARYYRDGEADPNASSHWRQYSAEFDVQADAAGNILSASGAGFGQAHWAGARHRLADGVSVASHLAWLQPRVRILRFWRQTRAICRAMGIDPTFDAFRQACTCELLDRFLDERGPQHGRVLVIGDGFGILSALVKAVWPDARLTLIDLGRTLVFQALGCQRAYPQLRHVLANDPDAMSADFVYCPADDLALLESSTFDVAVNVASMQEMTPEAVARYFSFLRRRLASDNLFYCCNREHKVLPDGEESAFHKYPWSQADRVLVDGRCPWHQYYLVLRPPFVRRYDGTILHRLAVLSREVR